MSELAIRVRRDRRRWAQPGSGHDRTIARARIALPAAIVLLALVLLIAPIAGQRDISFVLDKKSVQVARERMRVSEATYRGRDSKGQPFEMRAGSAVQVSSSDPVVKLQQLNARIQLATGPAVLVAPRGRYDMDKQRVAIDGDVHFASADGYRLATQNVVIDLPSRRLASFAPVSGTMPLGTYSADRLTGNLEDRTVVLSGRAHLHIDRRNGRAAR